MLNYLFKIQKRIVMDMTLLLTDTHTNITRRRLVAEATRRSSELILKESFLSQVLLPTMHEIVDDGQDVLCFGRYLRILFFLFSNHPS